MKTIGLIGGLTWESTIEYYRIINEEIAQRLGGVHSARILMHSFDFQDIDTLMLAGHWEEIGAKVAEAGLGLESLGADFLLICSNTIHKVAEAVSGTASIPLIHLADVTAKAVKEKGIGRVGLLGTIFTMEHDFDKDRLADRHGLEILVPEKDDRNFVSRVIDEELSLGELKEGSKARFLRIIEDLAHRGAGGVILGCTEIPLLIKQSDTPVAVFDTTHLHSLAAVEESLEEDSLVKIEEKKDP